MPRRSLKYGIWHMPSETFLGWYAPGVIRLIWLAVKEGAPEETPWLPPNFFWLRPFSDVEDELDRLFTEIIPPPPANLVERLIEQTTQRFNEEKAER